MTDHTDDNSRILTYLEAEFGAGTNGGVSPRFGRKKKAPEVILPSAKEVLVELPWQAQDRPLQGTTSLLSGEPIFLSPRSGVGAATP